MSTLEIAATGFENDRMAAFVVAGGGVQCSIVCQRVCVSPTEMALYYNVYSFSMSSVFLVFVLVSNFTERESQFQQRLT